MAGKTLLAVAALATVALAGCAGTSGQQTFDQLHALYTDQPYMGGQATPMHTWLRTGPDTLMLLHWNHDDPRQATGLMFVGDGFRARGCVGSGGVSQAQIDAGYVHFHKEVSANWDAGHHTSNDPNTMGWWLRHIAAADGVDPMGVGAVPKGEVYPLMPSYENAPSCGLIG